MRSSQIIFGFLPMQIVLLITLASFCKGDETPFAHKPFNFTNMSGENVTIPCILNTSEEVECHWLLNTHLKFPKDNKYSFARVATNGDCSIRISNLNMKDDDGDWQCQVYSKQTYIAPPVRVTILMPPDRPRILFQSRAPEERKIIVEANKTTEIECISLNGNPAPELRWLINGRSLGEEARIYKNISTGFIKSVLVYSFDKMMNGDRLVCASHHQLVNEEDEVQLDVIYKPIVRIDSDVITVEERNDLRNVYCNVEANPPARIKWFDTTNPKILYSSEAEIRLSDIRKEQNDRVYECFAENEIGKSNIDSFKLNVLYEPQILSESSNQLVKLHKSATLNCEIDANPSPSIVWYHVNVFTGEIKQMQSDSNDQSRLFIRNVTYRNDGNYFCEATNKINEVSRIARSRDINLKVSGSPGLLKEKITEDGNLDERSEIDLEFCADPQPDMIYWKAGACRIILNMREQTDDSCERYTAVLRSLIPQVVIDNERTSSCYRTTLIINETKMEDEISYELVVENKEGKLEHSIKLNVNSPISLVVLMILVLIIFVLLLAIGFLVIVVLRRKHKGSENMNDDVLKEEAQTISHKSDLENGTTKDFNQLNLNAKNDSYELVYANLDFSAREQPTEQLFQGNNLNLQQQQQLLQQQKSITQANQMKFDLPTANKRVPPQVRPKPQMRPQPRQTNGSTEYAKLTFSKADL